MTAASLEPDVDENTPVVDRSTVLTNRGVAHFLDSMILGILGCVIFFVVLVLALILGILTGVINQESVEVLKELDKKASEPHSEMAQRILIYYFGCCILAGGIGLICHIAYFMYSELAMDGQTFGKRICGLRVVRIDGSPLNFSTSFIRNSMRLIEIFPIMLMPLFSKRLQRLGDMLAGTIVIAVAPEKRHKLERADIDFEIGDESFKFELAQLERVRSQDFHAIKRVLERWNRLSEVQRNTLLDQLVPPLVERLQATPPVLTDRARFIRDLLDAENRRQQNDQPVAPS
ncbi:MAG: putative rane protein/domain protein [Planctomycetaceae bacterium]|nr:putative rane protein/domain protein [Planctomycetaceae bacterium]